MLHKFYFITQNYIVGNSTFFRGEVKVKESLTLILGKNKINSENENENLPKLYPSDSKNFKKEKKKHYPKLKRNLGIYIHVFRFPLQEIDCLILTRVQIIGSILGLANQSKLAFET